MSNQPHATQIERNEAILARIEALGGGSVWVAEVFAVTLMDVAVTDGDAIQIAGLMGVQQIALDCSRFSIKTLRSIAEIHEPQSLVLCNPVFSAAGLQVLQAVGPEVQVVAE